MADKLLWRRYYARGRCHDRESYGAVCAADGANHALAYIRVQGKREGLVYKADPAAVEVLVTQNSYVFSPVLVAGLLVWVEQRKGHWVIRSLATNNVATGQISEPIGCSGRPINLHAVSGNDKSVLVWEERSGRHTVIRGASIHEGVFSLPVDMTAGVYNAYDPHCAILRDGKIVLAYTAYYQGQYHVFIQHFDESLFPLGVPVRVSHGRGAALYPSVCERSDGGVWFSFARARTGMHSEHVVTHFRHNEQVGVFAEPMTLSVGVLDNEKVYAPLSPPEDEPLHGFAAAMIVHGSEGGGRSCVFEDASGRLRLLARQHVDRNKVGYEDDDVALVRSSKRGAVEGSHCYSSIVLMTLGDLHWSQPKVLISIAHVHSPLSFGVRDGVMHFAFTEDGRHTGLNAAGEWMDSDSEVAVGCAEVALSEEVEPRYELRPYVIGAVAPEGIADPVFEINPVGEYTVAMGQFHAHSEISVCHREIDRDGHFNYRFLQDVQNCDFGTLCDHSFNMWQTEMLIMRKLAAYYYFPGTFVALQGYEWTGSSVRYCSHDGGPWGHMGVVMFDEKADLDCDYPGDRTCEGHNLQALCNKLRPLPVVVIPHHMVDTLHSFKWGEFDGEVMPVVELFEDLRGSCEKPSAPGVSHTTHDEQGSWCDIELLSGKQFGFVAGGGHGGVARTGILTRDLTREALYEALTARRCFASSGTALNLSFAFNGEPIGSEVAALKGEFALDVSAPCPIHSVQIVRNGLEEKSIAVNADSFRHAWSVERRRNGEFWYCRILLANSEIAWTSPIWIGLANEI